MASNKVFDFETIAIIADPVILDAIQLERKEMHFRIAHILLLLSVISIAFAMRDVAIYARSALVTFTTTIVIAPITTLTMQIFGSNLKKSIASGVLSSALVLGILIADCLLQTPATDYAWRYISGDLFLIVVPVYLTGALMASTMVALLGASVIRVLNGITLK